MTFNEKVKKLLKSNGYNNLKEADGYVEVFGCFDEKIWVIYPSEKFCSVHSWNSVREYTEDEFNYFLSM